MPSAQIADLDNLLPPRRAVLNALNLRTFSPASSGNVHIFVTASRALLACTVHTPGKTNRQLVRMRLVLLVCR